MAKRRNAPPLRYEKCARVVNEFGQWIWKERFTIHSALNIGLKSKLNVNEYIKLIKY